MVQEKKNEEFDSSNFIILLYKYRKPLSVILLTGIVFSWFFSLPIFIPPKYRATVILYPVSSGSVSKAMLSDNPGKNDDLTAFGEIEEAEQLLQILNSNKIRDRVISKFRLMEHYGIDSNSKYKNSRLFRKYEKNISYRTTEYLAVQITVYDEDPQMAATIANTIGDLLDSTKNEMQRQRAWVGFKIVESEYHALQREVSMIVDSLVVLGKLGVNDVEYQSQVLNQQMAIAIMNGNKPAQVALQKKLDILGKYGGIYMLLKNSLEFKTEQLTLLQGKYKEAKVDVENNIPQKFVVSNAYKAEEKSYPIRWLIILVSAISLFFISVIVIIAREKISNYNTHKKFQLE